MSSRKTRNQGRRRATPAPSSSGNAPPNMREQPALSAKGEGEGKAQQPAPTKSKKAKIAEEKAAREAADAEAKVQYHFVCSNQCVVHCTCVNSGAPPIGSGATASSQYTQPTSSSTTHSEWIASGYSSSSSSSSSSFASASASAGATALTSALDHFLSGTVPNTPQNAAAVEAMASHLKCGGCTSGVGRHRADCSKSMESTAAYTRAQLAGNLAGAAGLAGFSYGIGGSMTRLHDGMGMGGDDYGDDDGEGGARVRDDSKLLGLPGGLEEEKRQRRLAINRRAAHNSRIRKKQLVESLKTTVADVLKQNESLRVSNHALQTLIYAQQMENQSQ